MSILSTLRTLKEIAPPPEPRLAHPESLLSSQELLALVRGKVFFAADQAGNLMPAGAPHVGLFRDDTRFLSHLELRVNQHEPIILSSNVVDGAFLSRVELTVKGGEPGVGLDLPVNTVYMHRAQLLESDVLQDVVQMESFHREEVSLLLELAFDVDFMDIFQVRGLIRNRSGRYFEPVVEDEAVTFFYLGLDHKLRSTCISFSMPPEMVEGRRARWRIKLPTHGKAELITRIASEIRELSALETEQIPHLHCTADAGTMEQIHASIASMGRRYDDWVCDCTAIRSDNDIFNCMISTTISDFFALQMPHPSATAIAAGVPWFAALFGRDSLIASLQTLMLNRRLAKGTLRILAHNQGTQKRDDNDEDPGKILHEFRDGEMTATGEIAFGRNYGSVDATPLFLVLVDHYLRWTADEAFLEEMRPHIAAAARWLLDYGDLDGDGLIEYCRRSPKGLFNQGWKDSGDANLHADGSLAEPPVALVEVQGYAIAALRAAARILDDSVTEELARRAQERAVLIEEKLESQFWQQEGSYYAMALDRDKLPLRVLSSNPGHLLFVSAISLERAAAVADSMLSPQLSSGWGIRTLAAEQRVYNPMSYHRGSVWPHDNSLIAYGMCMYGHHERAATVATALYDAALHFKDYRLPELYCGTPRRQRDEPVHYPVSCSPQAWASGALLLVLQGLLGLHPDAECKQLRVENPHLPQFLNKLTISNLEVGQSRISLAFERQHNRTFCNLLDIQGEPITVSVEFH